MYMPRILKAFKRNLMNIQNKILQQLEICHLKLVRLFGQDICLRRLLDLFTNSQKLLSRKMNFKLNLLVIIPLDLNLKYMNNGFSEHGAKKLKELKQDYKLH